MLANNLPLAQKCILVTRPGSRGKELAQALENLGATSILLPLIELAAPESAVDLDAAIDRLNTYDWLFLASENAVNFFFERVRLKGKGAKLGNLPAGDLPQIAAIGQVTKQAIKALGLDVAYCPADFNATKFIETFPGYPDQLKGWRILWPRTNIGSNQITLALSQAGAKVEIVSAYKTIMPANFEQIKEQIASLLNEGKLDAITIANKQTAVHLAKIIEEAIISGNLASQKNTLGSGAAPVRQVLSKILIVTIGPEASAGALNYLGKVDIEANLHTASGMVEALVRHYKEGYHDSN